MTLIISVAAFAFATALLHHFLRPASLRKWVGLTSLVTATLVWWWVPQGLYLGIERYTWLTFLICVGTSLFAHRNRYRD